MKEAAGEANMTVITIVLIAIVLGVGTIVVVNMMNSVSDKSKCNNAGGCYQSGKCYRTSTFNESTGKATCDTSSLMQDNEWKTSSK